MLESRDRTKYYVIFTLTHLLYVIQQMEHLLKELLTTLCFVQVIKPGLQVNLLTCMITFTVIEM